MMQQPPVAQSTESLSRVQCRSWILNTSRRYDTLDTTICWMNTFLSDELRLKVDLLEGKCQEFLPIIPRDISLKILSSLVTSWVIVQKHLDDKKRQKSAPPVAQEAWVASCWPPNKSTKLSVSTQRQYFNKDPLLSQRVCLSFLCLKLLTAASC